MNGYCTGGLGGVGARGEGRDEAGLAGEEVADDNGAVARHV